MPKSLSTTAIGVKAIARRLAAEAGRLLCADEEISPSALGTLAFELAYEARADDGITDDDQVTPATVREMGLAAALERCAEELVKVNAPGLKMLAGALDRLQRGVESSGVDGALEGARRELTGDVALAADEFSLATAHLEEKMLRLRRELSAAIWSPLPKVQLTRGAFYPNLAKDLRGAGFNIPKIGDLIEGPSTGKVRRATQNRIRKMLTAKDDTVTAVLDLGVDLEQAYYDSVISELEGLGFKVTALGA